MDSRSARPESALAGVRQIRGVSWRWREDVPLAEISERGGEPQVGVIAQEVQAAFPELVVEGASGYLMVNYLPSRTRERRRRLIPSPIRSSISARRLDR